MERVHFSISPVCATPSLGGSRAGQVVLPPPPGAPQGRTGSSSELLSLLLHQASSLRPEAAGTRRGQPSRPPQARLPLLEQAGPPLPPSHNCQQGSPAHTCHGGLHSQPLSSQPTGRARQAGTRLRCGTVEAGSSQQSCYQQSFKWGA